MNTLSWIVCAASAVYIGLEFFISYRKAPHERG